MKYLVKTFDTQEVYEAHEPNANESVIKLIWEEDDMIKECKRIKHDINGNPRYYIETNSRVFDETVKKLNDAGFYKWRNGNGFKWWCQSYMNESQVKEYFMEIINK